MKTPFVREYYEGALFALLRKKPLEEITIVELVEKAGASRASFYRNYSSKEQILEGYLERVFGSIHQRHRFTMENMHAEVRSIFAELYEHRNALRILKEAGQIDLIDRHLYRETLEQINRLEVLHNKYQPYFFAGATASLIKAWISFDFSETPEEMAAIFFRSLAGYMPLDRAGREEV